MTTPYGSDENARMEAQIRFILEIDKLKDVNRQSRVLNGQRFENSAEHSWHVAMCALIFSEYRENLDLEKTLKMLLIHDIVEIISGDTPFHGNDTEQHNRERFAAKMLFGILPDDLEQKLTSIWEEFEEGSSIESRFAKGLDRLQPLLLNVLCNGGTWKLNNLSENDVNARYGPVIRGASPALWNGLVSHIKNYFAKYH